MTTQEKTMAQKTMTTQEKTMTQNIRYFIVAAALAVAGVFAQNAAAQEATIIYSAEPPSLVSLRSSNELLYVGKTAGLHTATVIAITGSVTSGQLARDPEISPATLIVPLQAEATCVIRLGCGSQGQFGIVGDNENERSESFLTQPLSTIRAFVDSNANLNQTIAGFDSRAHGPIITRWAASPEDIGRLSVFITAGANVNLTNNSGNTPLLLAAASNPAGVSLLISAGANLNTPNSRDSTPLHIAVFQRNTAAMSLLISAGANVNVSNSNGSTPLHHAAFQSNVAAISLLISAGASVNVGTNSGSRPLHTAASRGNTAIISLLVSAGANVNVADNQGGTPLIYAVLRDNPAAASVLIAEDADVGVSVGFSDDDPLLHYAVGQESTAVLSVLIAAGADVNGADKVGDTPLHALARSYNNILGAGDSYVFMASVLLAADGIDANRSVNERTPLFYMVQTHARTGRQSPSLGLIDTFIEHGGMCR